MWICRSKLGLTDMKGKKGQDGLWVAPVANDNAESESPVTENANNTEAKASITKDANVVDTGSSIAPDADDVETKSLTIHDADDTEAESSIKLDIENAEGEAQVANNDKTEAPDKSSGVHPAVQPPSTSPARPTANQASSPTRGAMIELGLNGVDFDKYQWPPWMSPAVDALRKLSSNKIWRSLIQDWLSIEKILKYPGGVRTYPFVCVVY